jgi:hypothetical protein
MFTTLKRLYDSKRLPMANLKKAVVFGWITADEFKEITGEDYTV